MEVFESIVGDELLAEFPKKGPRFLTGYAGHFVGLPETLSVVSVLWPRIIEIDGLVFLDYQFQYTETRFKVEPKYSHLSVEEKQHIERLMNACSLGQMFYGESIEVLDDVTLFKAYEETLKFFWSLRLQSLFPTKKFYIETGNNIAGEEGMVITFYQTSYE
ncbi:hypothetical protein [Tengunoibacter tsumagoiensis]|uniref:Uncharacterized protein n=1 Tax=Tengunoibacter tsumagoiensis TaxID=2014871 RepID=A0A401ZVV0_9CHLR|nr:hypothetical protein [Tengunoibacter tsumagoiensis]GCE11033.1 hypothetical protein KTT_08920 [Tengunoibacter tsumagoiensis]